MSQTVKPDRPIWPPVPETPAPQAPHPRHTDRETAPAERPAATDDHIAALGAFEGFGSFSG